MSLFIFFTVIQAIVAAALVGVVLMQKSEGGGLGIGGGGSPGGMLSARGAADFLTRITKWLAVLFVVFAIILAGLAINASGSGSMDDTLDRSVESGAAADPLAPVVGGEAPAQGDAVTDNADADTQVDSDPLADVIQ